MLTTNVFCYFNPCWWAERRREAKRERGLHHKEAMDALMFEQKKVRERRQREQILRFPEKIMSADELGRLQKGSDVDLNTCPLDTWFICKLSDLVPDLVVVGQVVEGDKMIAEQWGAGLSVPPRGINRYRLRVS